MGKNTVVVKFEKNSEFRSYFTWGVQKLSEYPRCNESKWRNIEEFALFYTPLEIEISDFNKIKQSTKRFMETLEASKERTDEVLSFFDTYLKNACAEEIFSGLGD